LISGFNGEQCNCHKDVKIKQSQLATHELDYFIPELLTKAHLLERIKGKFVIE